MSNSRCHTGFAGRRFLLPLVSLTFAGFGFSATAQTAPQLLPYTVKLIAGGGSTVIASGATCPVSGFKSLDAYGDGCLATEIEIGNTATGANTPGARSAVPDAGGNVFFTDYNNGLVRRVDAITGVVTAVAGGATSSPASGTTCGAGTSTDAIGDGCLGTLVKLSHPAGIVFAPNGDLYFSDVGQGQVRKIAATAGAITTTGVISLVAGNVAGTYGYAASNATTTIVAATQSYLRSPYGLSFDSAGDLFIVDEYTEVILVVNTNATGTNTVNSVPVAAGTIWKIAGTSTGATAPYCVNGTATGYGCSYGLYTQNIQANTDIFDSTYSVAVDPNGVVYAGNEYYDSVFKVTTAGVLSTFAGIQNSVGAKPTIAKRGPAGSFGIGSMFGVAADANSNVYITDASSGAIWRVDGAGQSMYVIAGGATSVCSAATDTYGDGCPGTQAKFGSSGSGNYATATLPGPGIYGISVDAYSNLYVGDTETNLIREVAAGTQFGNVGASQTNVVEVHFAANDSAAAGGYTLTSGASIFSLGTPSCTTNSDLTTDCLLPITASPSVLGAFTGTLQVQSQLNGIATFPLTGNFVPSPVTRTAVSATGSNAACTGSTVYSTTAPSILTASLVANGPSSPTGSIIFYANGTALAPTSGVAVSNIGTAGAPVYGATLSYTFATPGTYTITATYSGDSYFKTSTSAAGASLTTALPAFAASAITYQQNTVSAGQIALYSFNLAQTVYTGTITFSASGLPANSSVIFSPTTITASGCSATNTVAVSIVTQQGSSALQSSIGGGKGLLGSLTTLLGLGLALIVGLRRRRAPLRYGHFWMALALLLGASGTVACNNSVTAIAGTPSGPYTITITATGSTGTVSTFTIPLTVK